MFKFPICILKRVRQQQELSKRRKAKTLTRLPLIIRIMLFEVWITAMMNVIDLLLYLELPSNVNILKPSDDQTICVSVAPIRIRFFFSKRWGCKTLF